MATVSRAGPRFGATYSWARFSTQPASANAPSMNTGRPSRPTTIPRAHSRNAAATCKSLTSGKKEVKLKKCGPYHQANGGTSQEGTIQSIEQIPSNVQVGLWTLFDAHVVAGACPAGRGEARSRYNLDLDPIKPLAPLLAVAVQSVLDDGIRFGCCLDLVHLDRFSLQLFVVLKKAAQHDQPVRRHFRRFAVGVELRIFGGDGDDLVIFLPRVDHGHESDGARVDDSQRHDGFLAQHQHIKRIVVLGKSLRNEAIVRGIVDRRVQDAVEVDQASGLVQFVFHAGAEGNLDDGVELLRKLAAGSYVMPRMNHGIRPAFAIKR